MTVPWQSIITFEPGKRGGKACIRGMRIAVHDVLSYLASGMSPDEVLGDFSYLTREDIQACLSYAADRERKLLVVQRPIDTDEDWARASVQLAPEISRAESWEEGDK